MIGLLSLTGVLSISLNIILPLHSLFNMYVCITVVLYLCHHVSFCVMLIWLHAKGHSVIVSICITMCALLCYSFLLHERVYILL